MNQERILWSCSDESAVLIVEYVRGFSSPAVQKPRDSAVELPNSVGTHDGNHLPHGKVKVLFEKVHGMRSVSIGFGWTLCLVVTNPTVSSVIQFGTSSLKYLQSTQRSYHADVPHRTHCRSLAGSSG